MNKPQHLWSYRQQASEKTVGPVAEAHFMALVKKGTIIASTLVCSETRTKNKWVAVSRIPAIAKHIKPAAKPPEAQAVAQQPPTDQVAVASTAGHATAQVANPYAAPATTGRHPPTPSSSAQEIYEKLTPLDSTVVTWLLRATLLFMAINAVFILCFILQGRPALRALGPVALVTGILQIVLGIVTAVFYLRWKYQAYRNLQFACVQPLKTSAGWCIGVYFIPIINLFRPAMAMHEIQSRSKAGIGGLVTAWWVMICLGSILNRIAMTAPGGSDNKAGHVMSLVAVCLIMIAGYLLLKIIRTVTEKQRRYRNSLVGNSN